MSKVREYLKRPDRGVFFIKSGMDIVAGKLCFSIKYQFNEKLYITMFAHPWG